MTAIAEASTTGLWYGRACSIVRKLILRVRCAAAAKSAVGCRRDRELGEEEVLDRRVAVVPEPVGVLDLLEHLGVQLLGALPLVELHLRVQAEPHRPPSS